MGIKRQLDFGYVTDPNEAKVEYAGNTYHILKDVRTDVNYPHPPSWYVCRASDGYVSKRYYSQPQGAFTALVTGAIQWTS
jgi:hypothetical protein